MIKGQIVEYEGNEYFLDEKWGRLVAIDCTGDVADIDISKAVLVEDADNRNKRMAEFQAKHGYGLTSDEIVG